MEIVLILEADIVKLQTQSPFSSFLLIELMLNRVEMSINTQFLSLFYL